MRWATRARRSRGRVGAIRTFYRWALTTGVTDGDPSALLGSPRVENRLPTVLRPREAAALREAPSDRRVPSDLDQLSERSRFRDRSVLELLYGSGLRVWARSRVSPALQVDLDRGRVLVRGKGNKGA